MAFKMNRPVIKGTTHHKASIAKAKVKPVVSQRRTQADAGLVNASRALGKSYKPSEIDFELDKIDIDVPKKKEKKEKQPRVKKEKNVKVEREVSEPIALEPRSIRSLPTNKQKLELQQSTGTVATTEFTNRFEKAAKKFGYDLSTEKGYKEAEKAMEYNDRTDEWQKPMATVDNLESKKQETSEEEKRIEAEVAAKQAETIRLEKERQAEKKAIADEKKRIQEEEKAKKKAEIEAKNVGIRERNKIKKEAREYYGDGKLTQKRLDAYKKMVAEQEEALNFQPEFEEQDDPDNFNEKAVSKPSEQELDEIAYKPQVVDDNVTEKPKISDFKTKKNPFGGTLTAKDQYEKALKEYYSKSPATMRDNRIYRNAVKGGIVQQNMIKSGYIPE